MKMKGCIFISLLYSLHTFVQCNLPNLMVKKLDKTMIARKRQDTMDMCRIFTEENQKINHNHEPRIIKSQSSISKDTRRYKRYLDTENPTNHNEKLDQRHKRDTDIKRDTLNEEDARRVEEIHRYKRDAMKYAVNPALNAEDARRVENIVDKMYDELEQKGQRVEYRKQNVETTISFTSNRNKTLLPSRRHDFAPAVLTGPQTTLGKRVDADVAPFDSQARWKHGIVPYFIDSKTYDAHLTEIIVKAFDYFEKATCIRLQKLREKPRDTKSFTDVPWLYISNPTGIRQCVHSNEKRRIDGVQLTVFGYDCMSLGDITHEVMHILGYSHEHLRPDRDQHISILWENIKPGYKKYFHIAADVGYDLGNIPYDYSSILHYPPRAFSKNGKATILTEPGIKVGQREGLSEIDVEKVALIYSNECVSRNREYLLQTCPSVVKSVIKPNNVTQKDIQNYFNKRLWPFGVVNYKLRDKMEFTTEERENINAVFRHIEQETCLQFRNAAADDDDDDNDMNQKLQNEPINDMKDPNVEKSKEKTEALENIDDVGEKVPEIIITHPKDENLKPGELKEPEIVITGDPRDLKENEITKEDNNAVNNNVVTAGENYLRTMNISMKRELLRRARAKKQKLGRYRRESPAAARRHASALLVLKRSPAPGCECPEPGKPDGDQVLQINADCFNSANDLLHFFVHILGLDHQHNMYDRDNYLHINWDNLTPDVRHEMEHKSPPEASAGFPYDYQSVMHYPWLQIKNGKTNIMYPIWNDGWAMGHWQGLSSVDVQKLNLLYFTQCMERQKQEKQ